MINSEEEVLQKIGEQLKELREQKGYTNYEKFAWECDMSRSHYWKIEKGKANITIRTLLHVLNFLEVRFEDFFGEMREESKNNE